MEKHDLNITDGESARGADSKRAVSVNEDIDKVQKIRDLGHYRTLQYRIV